MAISKMELVSGICKQLGINRSKKRNYFTKKELYQMKTILDFQLNWENRDVPKPKKRK